MRYAPIAPEQASPAILGSLSRYHFALAQYLRPGTEYFRMYQSIRARGDFLIVDNGAAENARLSFAEAVRRANAVGADEIVMPDVLTDGEATLRQTLSLHALGLVLSERRMIVPQGSSWFEWTKCFRNMLGELGDQFASVGIPKHIESFTNRVQACKYVKDHTEKPIHMLGLYGNPLKEIRTLKVNVPYVRGIDSGAAAAWAQAGKEIVDGDERYSLAWNKPIDSVLMAGNIMTLMEECNDPEYEL